MSLEFRKEVYIGDTKANENEVFEGGGGNREESQGQETFTLKDSQEKKEPTKQEDKDWPEATFFQIRREKRLSRLFFPFEMCDLGMWCDPCVRLPVVSWKRWVWSLGSIFLCTLLVCSDCAAGGTHMPQETEPRDQGHPLNKAAGDISFHLPKGGGGSFSFHFVCWEHLKNNILIWILLCVNSRQKPIFLNLMYPILFFRTGAFLNSLLIIVNYSGYYWLIDC